MATATATEVLMPALSSTMTEGKIVQWLKGVGDKVDVGDALMVVESDKADMDVESFEEGYISAILTDEGGTAAVGSPVAVLVGSPDDVGMTGSAAPAATPAESPADPPPAAPAAGGGDAVGVPITMPALSSTMTEGKIVQWLKNEGDRIEVGDAVMVVESDKADMDVEAFEEGFLAKIITSEGEAAAVGAPVAMLAASEAEIAAVAASGGGAAAPAEASAPVAAAPASAPSPSVGGDRVVASPYAKKVAGETGVDLGSVPGSGPGGRVVSSDVLAAGSSSSAAAGQHIPAPGVIAATPMARKMAKDNKLDLASIRGTGNYGRVTEDDVLVALGKAPKNIPPAPPAPAAAPATKTPASAAPAAPAGPASPKPEGVVPMTSMQKAVAKNMNLALDIPVFRVSRVIATDALDELTKKLKPKGVSVSVLLAKAAAMTLESYPIMNAGYDPSEGGAIKYNDNINVAMAVALDGGLITPTLKSVSTKDIHSLGREWKDLVSKAKEKRLSPDEYSHGTFAISNLGMFGVSQFDAILPHGTGAILAVSSSLPTVVAQKNGFFGVQKQMTVTITCDHRHIYGADAAMYLKDLADLIENRVDELLL